MEKLNCKSLMIGDWVYRPDCYDQVKEFRHTGVIGIDGMRGLITFNELEPIPLTPEILEKNGFTKEPDADGSHYRFILIDGHTKFSILYVRSVFQWLGPLDFKYVHELQHALRLCGIEKEIVL